MPFCQNCGTEVATGVASCPNCGHPQGAVGAPVYAARRTDGQAIASLVLGLAGLLVCPIVPSIFAVVIGNQSKARIATDPTLEGEGMAKTGVILGWVGIAVGALGLIAAALAFVFMASTGDFNIDVGR